MRLSFGFLMSLMFWLSTNRVEADAVARLTEAKLKAVHDSAEGYRAARQPVEVKTGYDDVRAILHCHSHWSHDSRSSIEEVIEGAHKAGVRVIMFTEHPADHYDYVTDGHQGIKDGVLLVPGAELDGMLAYPLKSLKGLKFSSPQEQSDMIKARNRIYLPPRRTNGLGDPRHHGFRDVQHACRCERGVTPLSRHGQSSLLVADSSLARKVSARGLCRCKTIRGPI